MSFSAPLKKYIEKSTFPLLSSDGLRLWNELVTAIENNPAGTTAEALLLIKGKFHNDLTYTFFDDHLHVNGVDITVGLSEVAMFIGSAHEALTKDFNTAISPKTIVPELIQRLRKKALALRLVDESSVSLQSVHSDHKMGTGLVTKSTLTYIPDPSLGPHTYGSTPNSEVISDKAPAWDCLAKRVYVNKDTGALGRKPHYVLAHLINHNINGSGSDPKNVIPFYAGANTEMANKVEIYLKDLVQRGAPVQYNISQGPKVGMTPNRTIALMDCTTEEEQEIINIEQYLPAYLTLDLAAQNNVGNWITIVNKLPIKNYVPETVPVIK